MMCNELYVWLQERQLMTACSAVLAWTTCLCLSMLPKANKVLAYKPKMDVIKLGCCTSYCMHTLSGPGMGHYSLSAVVSQMLSDKLHAGGNYV